MPRYIDADKINAELMDEYHGMISDESMKIYKIMQTLDNAPTADVEEVRHAKWVHYGEDIQCSNCGHVSDDICYEGDMDSGYYTVLPRYCSNCGAKMDLED